MEHCNLICDYCNSHANYVRSNVYDYEQIKKDILILSEAIHYSIEIF